jgi:hypothetical protein
MGLECIGERRRHRGRCGTAPLLGGTAFLAIHQANFRETVIYNDSSAAASTDARGGNLRQQAGFSRRCRAIMTLILQPLDIAALDIAGLAGCEA